MGMGEIKDYEGAKRSPGDSRTPSTGDTHHEQQEGSGIWEQCGNTEHFGHSQLRVSPLTASPGTA